MFTSIDSASFPDPVFRAYVAGLFGRKEGDVISEDRFYSVREIDVSDKGIADLTGIEKFINLSSLKANGNELESLDLSNNTRLIKLECGNNKLTSLELDKNIKLEQLDCSGNMIGSLDLTANTVLKELNCQSNGLATLKLSTSSLLERLDISDNPVTSLDIKAQTRLTSLDLSYDDKLLNIDLSNNLTLEQLYCSNTKLYQLDINNNPLMEELVCSDGKLGVLKADKCSRLKKLIVSNDQLTGFRVNSLYLDELDCSGNVRLMDFQDGSTSASYMVNQKIFSPEYVAEWYSGGFDNESCSFLLNGSDSCSYRYCLGTGSGGAAVYSDFTIRDKNAAAATSFMEAAAKSLGKTAYELTDEFVSTVTTLDVSKAGLVDLNGIEKFTSLETLFCHDNKIKSIDISSNKKLRDLYAYNNDLTELELGDSDALVNIDVSCNSSLGSIDISQKPELNSLGCFGCGLQELDVTNNTKLTILSCGNNQLTALDTKNNPRLNRIECFENAIQGELDLRNNPELVTVRAGNNEITSILLNGSSVLESLEVSWNKLTSLDVTALKNLKCLYCSKNPLVKLDLSSNTSLVDLYCNECGLNSLDLSMLDALTGNNLSGNKFKVNNSSGKISVSELSKYGFDPSKVLSWNGLTYDSLTNTITFSEGAEQYSYLYNCGKGITCEFALIPDAGGQVGFNGDCEIISAVFNGTEIEVTYTDSLGNTAVISLPAADVTAAVVAAMDVQNCTELVNCIYGTDSDGNMILTDGQLAAVEKVLDRDYRSR